MPKKLIFLPILLMIGFAGGFLGRPIDLRAQSQPLIKEGDIFPKVLLKVPQNAQDRSYLGISGRDRFAVKDLKAKVILVEIMNVYCSSCQNLTPFYNKLYELIQTNSEVKDQIKIVGIAAGNDEEEIKIFRDHFHVPFPIIPDKQYAMHKAIGGSATPFSIFVVHESRGKPLLVAGTHLGYNDHYQELFTQLKSYLVADMESIREKGKQIKSQVIIPQPPFSEKEILAKIKTAFFSESKGRSGGIEKIRLSQGREIYTILVKKKGGAMRLFARVISQKVTCDVCHDSHFIIIFDASGRILRFIPLQLTKLNNKIWDENDITQISRRVVGKYIFHPFFFKAKVDAVTSATITSAAIFEGLNEGQALYKELKKRGLI
jgi:thiol-disulfide isomerase/thioredoxin